MVLILWQLACTACLVIGSKVRIDLQRVSEDVNEVRMMCECLWYLYFGVLDVMHMVLDVLLYI